jgi:hypothetical protein
LKEKNVCVSRKNLCYRVAKSSLFSHCPLDLGVASSPHRPLGEMKRYLARSTSHEGSWPLRAKVIDLHLLIFPTDASRNRWKYDIFRVKVGRCCNLYSVLGWRLFGNSMVGVNKVVFFMVYIPGLEKRGYVLLISPLSMETSWFFF